jgi:hypothetical protein
MLMILNNTYIKMFFYTIIFFVGGFLCTSNAFAATVYNITSSSAYFACDGPDQWVYFSYDHIWRYFVECGGARTGLSPNTTYYYAGVYQDPCGGETNCYDSIEPTKSFVTLAVTPSVTTNAVTNIGSSSATGNGNVTATGGANPSQRIVQWGTASGSYTSSCDAGAGGTGAYACSMTSLSPNTTYYVRACAYNSGGWGCGAQTSFATVATTATVTTQAVSAIAATTATGNGTITSTGGSNPTRYIEWGTVSGTYPSSCNAGSGGTGAYTCSMTGLSPNTTYYVRARATNSAGTTYGAQTSFTTATTTATVTTQAVSAIAATTATGNGTITSTGGSNPTRYIEWGTVSGTYPSSCNAGSGGTGAYTCSMTGLSPNTTYYVQRIGPQTLPVQRMDHKYSFTTSVTTTPTVTTQAASSITATTATGNGTVTVNRWKQTRQDRRIQWGTVSGTYPSSCSMQDRRCNRRIYMQHDGTCTGYHLLCQRIGPQTVPAPAYGAQTSFTTSATTTANCHHTIRISHLQQQQQPVMAPLQLPVAQTQQIVACNGALYPAPIHSLVVPALVEWVVLRAISQISP